MSTFILILEIIGAAAFAASGAMVAIKRDMDILGVCVLGLVTAVGGGVTRDIILGELPPEMFQNPIYALVALATCIIIFIPHVQKFMKKRNKLVNFADAIGLGIFTVSGAAKAFSVLDANLFLAVFVGVITGVGGGLIRDVLAREIPYIFTKHVYATASIMGAILFGILYYITDQYVAMLVGATFIITIRMLATIFKWNLPKPKAK